MSARIALWTTLAAFLTVFALTIINGVNNLGVASYRFISPNNVRGMAVKHEGLLYTLNFEQQNDLIEAFNHAIPNTTKDTPLVKTSVSHIVIYPFNEPEIQVELLGFQNSSSHPQTLIFKNLQWFPGILSTNIPSSYSAMLANTYDPSPAL